MSRREPKPSPSVSMTTEETVGFEYPPPKSLAERLFREGYAFSFFQAVRVLERLLDNKVPIGFDGPQSNEIVRFRAHQSLSFPPSQIYTLDPPETDRMPPMMEVTFIGLTGPSGVLPRHYTELILRLLKEAKGPERTALRDWFDTFNHRIVSLFYRAWTKYRFFLAYERLEYKKEEPDPFTLALYSVMGLGLPHLRNRLRVAYWDIENEEKPDRTLAKINDLSLLFYSGLLSQRPRSAAALKAMLEDYFQIQVQVQQFQGQWLQLESSSQSSLTIDESNNTLGYNTVAGERVWDVLGRIRLCVGPMDYRRFTDFIPDKSISAEQKAFFLLVQLVRLFVGPELSFDVQMVLKAEDIPECNLDEDEDAVGARLGWNTWAVSLEAEFDANDAVFEGEEMTWINEQERLAARLAV